MTPPISPPRNPFTMSRVSAAASRLWTMIGSFLPGQAVPGLQTIFSAESGVLYPSSSPDRSLRWPLLFPGGKEGGFFQQFIGHITHFIGMEPEGSIDEGVIFHQFIDSVKAFLLALTFTMVSTPFSFMDERSRSRSESKASSS